MHSLVVLSCGSEKKYEFERLSEAECSLKTSKYVKEQQTLLYLLQHIFSSRYKSALNLSLNVEHVQLTKWVKRSYEFNKQQKVKSRGFFFVNKSAQVLSYPKSCDWFSFLFNDRQVNSIVVYSLIKVIFCHSLDQNYPNKHYLMFSKVLQNLQSCN